jgi:NADH-quinone oxidoreductase subunit G
LLSKDFLNKARAWDVDKAPSVCPNCSQGCNIMVETRDNVVVRLQPRPNDAVNKYFMCDHGRLNYRWFNRTDRIEVPMVRREDVLVATDWEHALPAAASVIKGNRVYVAASPNLSNEALFLLSKLIKMTGGAGGFSVETGPEAPLAGVEDLALRAERAANAAGAEAFGFTRAASALAGVQQGDVVIIADDELERLGEGELERASAVIVIGTTLPERARGASVVLPIANCVEEEGTFTNLRGRVQRFQQAKAAPGMARPTWFVLADLLTALGEKTDYYLPSDVFSAIAASHPRFAGMSYDSLGLRGLPVLDQHSAGAA